MEIQEFMGAALKKRKTISTCFVCKKNKSDQISLILRWRNITPKDGQQITCMNCLLEINKKLDVAGILRVLELIKFDEKFKREEEENEREENNPEPLS